jgi:transcriptional regulator with XRE-family HTH domain
MTSKQERLKEVYNHLRSYFGIHTQIDFAEAIRITRPALSSAMNGNEAYLTKNLFQKICATYPGVFNLDYLLTGEGTLLTEQGRLHNMDIKNTISPTPEPEAIDYSFLIDKAVEKATAYADKTISTLEKQVARYEKELDAKIEEIKRLQARIHELEAFTTVIRTDDPLRNYPFEVGVSEKKESPRAKL